MWLQKPRKQEVNHLLLSREDGQMLGVMNVLIDSSRGQRNRISHALILNQLGCLRGRNNAVTLSA